MPIGFSTFPHEIVPMPRIWAERIFREHLVYFAKAARGGHFAAFEQPVLFVPEIRNFSRAVTRPRQ